MIFSWATFSVWERFSFTKCSEFCLTLHTARLITRLIRDRYFVANILVYLRTLSAPSYLLPSSFVVVFQRRSSVTNQDNYPPSSYRIVLRDTLWWLATVLGEPENHGRWYHRSAALRNRALHVPVNGLGKLGRFARSYKMKLRDDGQMKRQENHVKKMQNYFEEELMMSNFC